MHDSLIKVKVHVQKRKWKIYSCLKRPTISVYRHDECSRKEQYQTMVKVKFDL